MMTKEMVLEMNKHIVKDLISCTGSNAQILESLL